MKVCITCGEAKELDAFGKNRSKKDGLNPKCKPCYAEYMRKYYRENKEKHLKRVAECNDRAREKRRQYMWDYFLENPCVDCGESDPLVLQHDHLGDKVDAVSRMVSGHYAWSDVLKEIEKCEVRCANCHTRKTAEQFGWYKEQR